VKAALSRVIEEQAGHSRVSHSPAESRGSDRVSFRHAEAPVAARDDSRTTFFVQALSGILAGLTATAVAVSPHLVNRETPPALAWGLSALWICGLAVAIGYGCCYLDAVLEYSLAGGERAIPRRDLKLRPAMVSLARWGLAFCSGPVVLACLAIRHSLRCTIITPGDVLIVGMLLVAATSYWIIGIIASTDNRRRWPPLPEQLLSVGRQLNWRAIVAGLAATIAGLVYGGLAVSILSLSANPWPLRLVLYWLWWLSAWECGAFVLRTVGFCHFRMQAPRAS
jgi:hypothetical protein